MAQATVAVQAGRTRRELAFGIFRHIDESSGFQTPKRLRGRGLLHTRYVTCKVVQGYATIC